MGSAVLESYSHPMLYVNNLSRAVQWYKEVLGFEERGVKVGEPRTEGESHRFVSFWDSEGNTLGLEQARR